MKPDLSEIREACSAASQFSLTEGSARRHGGGCGNPHAPAVAPLLAESTDPKSRVQTLERLFHDDRHRRRDQQGIGCGVQFEMLLRMRNA